MKLNIIVNGACGKMGQEVVKTVITETEHNLVGVSDINNTGENIMEIVNLPGKEITINGSLSEAIASKNADVIIDFTTPEVVLKNISTGLKHNMHMIVGTTGITDADFKDIRKMAEESQGNIFIAPNFAIGAVLMMNFAKQAAKYMDNVEIIELHHDQKIDAPSGTSMRTAELINESAGKNFTSEKMIEKLKGARGGNKDGIHIHSVRLPGLVAHQEVIFGGQGQTLTLRHDSYNRTSFMPGVKLALDKIYKIDNLVVGLENLMEL